MTREEADDLTLALVLATRVEYRPRTVQESLHRVADMIIQENGNPSIVPLVLLTWQSTPCSGCRIETVVVDDAVRYDDKKPICEFCNADLTV